MSGDLYQRIFDSAAGTFGAFAMLDRTSFKIANIVNIGFDFAFAVERAPRASLSLHPLFLSLNPRHRRENPEVYKRRHTCFVSHTLPEAVSTL